jgi:hypothetical protein
MNALFTLIIGIFLILSYQNGLAQDSVKVAEDSVKLIDNNFNGKIALYQPEVGTSGEIKFFGSNTTIADGVTVEAGVPVTGRAVKHREYGEAQFYRHNISKSVSVNGMPASAVVTVTYKHEGAVLSADALMAVKVDELGGSFTVYRSDANNTSDLQFYWNAEWEE